MSVSFPREPLVTADLLSFMSCIEPKAIPRSILPDVEPEGQMVHASGMLCAYALVARRGNETHDIHRPVHWLLEFRGGVWAYRREDGEASCKSISIRQL